MIPKVKCNFIRRPSGLLDYAIDEQLEMCRMHPRYICSIVGASEYFLSCAFSYIDKNIINRDEIKPMRKCRWIRRVAFVNGSVINFYILNGAKRLPGCHGAIVDFMLDNDLFECVVTPSVKFKISDDDNPLRRLYVARIALSYSESSDEYLTVMPNIELQSVSSNEYTLVYSRK